MFQSVSLYFDGGVGGFSKKAGSSEHNENMLTIIEESGYNINGLSLDEAFLAAGGFGKKINLTIIISIIGRF